MTYSRNLAGSRRRSGMGALGVDPSTIKSITIRAYDLQQQVNQNAGNTWWPVCLHDECTVVNGEFYPGAECHTFYPKKVENYVAQDGVWGRDSQKALFDGVNQMTPFTRSVTGNPTINTTPYYRTNAAGTIVRLPVLWFSDPYGIMRTPDPTRADRAVTYGGPGYGYSTTVHPTVEQLADAAAMEARGRPRASLDLDAAEEAERVKRTTAAAQARRLAASVSIDTLIATPPQPGLDIVSSSPSSAWVAAGSAAAVLLGLSLWAWAAQKHN